MGTSAKPIKRPLYFDNHATTPLDPRVLEAMLPYFKETFGNAESVQHAYGWEAKSGVDKARAQVAALIGAQASEIIFTSGATESLHLAILGFVEALNEKCHIITANAEHKATLEVCARASKLGHELTVLPVDRQGRVTTEQVLAAVKPHTKLVTLMHGNNEIGTLHPIREIGEALSERGITFHVDAAQTVGKIPVNVNDMKISLLSISAHKFYGPKGSGALFVRRSQPHVSLKSYMVGGGQERGLRGGTPNVPGIIGLGVASEIALTEMAEESARVTQLRNRVITEVTSQLSGVVLNGHPTDRLSGNVSFTFEGIQGDDLLLGMNDIAYSSASACSAGGVSHVLKAIGQDVDNPFLTTVRFGIGRFTTAEEVSHLIQRLVSTVQNAREKSKA